MALRVVVGGAQRRQPVPPRPPRSPPLARHYLWLTDAYFVGGSDVHAGAPGGGATVSTCACWCRGRATSPALLTAIARRATGRCSRRVSARSSGTGRCCTRRPRSPTASGRASVRPTSIWRASSGNWELDVAIEDRRLCPPKWRNMYEDDLRHATEIVLDAAESRAYGRRPHRRATALAPGRPVGQCGAGGGGRAVRVGSAVGAALTNRRLLGPAEAGLLWLLAGFPHLPQGRCWAWCIPRWSPIPLACCSAGSP